MSRLQIGDAHDRSQRQSKMRRRHGVHVIQLAVRSAPVVIWSAIPARHPRLLKDGLRSGGNLDLLVFSSASRFFARRCWRWNSRGRFFLLRRRRGWCLRLRMFMPAAAQKYAAQQEKKQKTSSRGIARNKAAQELLCCVSRKSANWESFPAAVRSAFEECVRTAGTTSSFRYVTSSAVSFSRVSAIFATDRLKRAEASSTLRSNSVLHILPVRINVPNSHTYQASSLWCAHPQRSNGQFRPRYFLSMLGCLADHKLKLFLFSG